MGIHDNTGIESYCNSSFWDLGVTWNTNHPQFTACFHKTVFIWTPCGFLWVFGLMQIVWEGKKSPKVPSIPFSVLNITKYTGCIALVAITAGILGLTAFGDDPRGRADIGGPVMLMATFLFDLVIMLLDKWKGNCGSLLLLMFWFFLSSCDAFTISAVVLAHKNETVSQPMYALYITYYVLVVLQCILNCFAEKRSDQEQLELDKQCPHETCSALSRFLFMWMDPMMWKGYKQPLKAKDLWKLPQQFTSEAIVPKFEKELGKTLEVNHGDSNERNKVSLIMTLLRVFGPEIVFGLLVRLCYDLMLFINPQILSLIIDFIETKNDRGLEVEYWKGIFYSLLMLFVAILMTIIQAKYFYIMMLAGMKIRTSLCGALFKKALLMDLQSRKDSTIGEIVNLMAVDAQRFIDATTFLGMVTSTPVQLGLCLYFLYNELGWAVIAAIIVVLLMIPLQIWFCIMQKNTQAECMNIKDERARKMSEIFSGMKVLKLYGWEPSFEQLVTSMRQKELNLIMKMNVIQAFSTTLMVGTPFFLALAVFTTYILMDDSNVLTSDIAFVSLSLVNLIRFPLSIFPTLLTFVVQARVSVQRLNKYFSNTNLDVSMVSHEKHSDKYTIDVKNASFSWSKDEPAFLRNMNIHAKPGSLIAVVGSVGAGKTSFVHALLGEMIKKEGSVNVMGSLAYVPQQAWIQNSSVRDNILFGSTFDYAWYRKVISSCALKPDFEMLSAGDQTEIGEKGINISGGQKQRISLARAVYSSADIYYLDDPLSAVDSHVGAHLFDQVIGKRGLLREKTRVLVTHALTFVPNADVIIVLKNGQVVEMGSYKELMHLRGELRRLVEEFIAGSNEDDQSDTQSRNASIITAISQNSSMKAFGSMRSRNHHTSVRSRVSSVVSESEVIGGVEGDMQSSKLISEETVASGAVSLATVMFYVRSMTWFALGSSLLGFSFTFVARVVTDIWLSDYTDQKIQHFSNGTEWVDQHDTTVFLAVYAAIGISSSCFGFMSDFGRAFAIVYAAKLIHHSMLRNVFHCPMAFFDTTPIGRLVNRFSKDVDVVDTNFPQSSRTCLWGPLCLVASFFVIAFASPIFLAPLVLIVAIVIVIQRFYVKTSNQLRRIEAVTRSPIYSLYGEALGGVTSVRAYGCEERFIEEIYKKVDHNQSCYFPYIASSRWLSLRLETVASFIVFCAAILAVTDDSIDSSTAGLSISYAMSISPVLNWLVRQASESEAHIVSVERCIEYMDVPQEPEWDIESSRPPKHWPSRGEVRFENYSTRYREDRDLVIKGITCTIKSGEKVGIVGRTGAGKSSLTLALFRIIEAAGGAIYIDDIDISTLGLHNLRAGITIIPQDPVLFSGTLRMNLDPFDAYSDDEVWKALDLAHLKDFVYEIGEGLEHQITEGGENLSVGQRQLVCLARALLRKTKILILDEATAAVDLETDQLIQNTVRVQFNDCTIITIAHRLNTIMDYNKVMVLDQGLLKEFDSPPNLLEDTHSIFHSMAKAANLV